ncbi:hypothetical protein A2363_02110 [Candidatus Gottesmanbacteria bacterium RIFOXYB1_FULL_47_11]|uniref:DUF1648 domain-containing protein n=1 Tax=Candidatus Gottesmanbacteria bacterium RIFOXYB1_FULL_47_11 TaxID=1798401 RepID=A0A1F6BDW7_9BACT|nr:MAG: hypothetical protein A2363_02110 [Candidatus Gottesmanbacteria bacterium RIFOXYB1_FULL_47_11]
MNIFRGHAQTVWRTLSVNWVVGLSHKFVLICFVLSLGILLWRWRLLPPMVPLWYSRPWGADQMTEPYWLFLLPMASMFLYIVNVVVSIYFTAEYLIFTQMLFLSSLIVSLLSFITLVKIVFLVT